MTSYKKEKLKKAAHIIAGVVILLHAFEKYESGHQTYIYFILFGILFLSIALFHHALKAKFAWIDTVFYAIETVLSLIIAYDYFHEHKNGLAFTYILAAIFQTITIYVFSKRRTE